MTDIVTYIVRTDDGIEYTLDDVYPRETPGWLSFYADAECDVLVAGFAMSTVTAAFMDGVRNEVMRAKRSYVAPDEGQVN